jgi:outer membrane protein assembly factor BamB
VTAGDKTLYAINQATGATAWSRTVGGTYPVPSVAYDRGTIYTLNYDGLVSALDPASGSLRWSKQIPGSGFEGPVTAHEGTLYASGNGQLVALRATDGRLQWSGPVLNGDWSSPAVNGDLAHVSYSCQQVYGFDRLTGAIAWHASGPCSGGGGRTAVAAAGRVYAREEALGGNNIYDAATGATLGPFNAGPAPAVAGGVMYAGDGTALRAVSDAGLGTNQWSFPGDGQLQSAPLAVGGLVFVGSATGMLHAVDAPTGVSAWSTNVGIAIPHPDELNVSQPLTGLGAANGTLVVPAGNKLFAYRSAGAIVAPPSNTAAPTIDGAARQG